MKKLLIGIGVVFVIFETVYAAYQPHNLGWTNISIASATVTEISISTPATVGMLKFCSNCAGGGGAGTICISTSVAAPGAGSDFVLSTGTQCK